MHIYTYIRKQTHKPSKYIFPCLVFKATCRRRGELFTSTHLHLHSPHLAFFHSMDTAQWPQEIVVKPMEEIVVAQKACITSSESCKKVKAQIKEAPQMINCPRCNSSNTKFCYYNNYSLSQPRYFCKTCRRYWTEGGSLRNIPVGGGSRKNNNNNNKRSSDHNSSPSQSNSSASSKKVKVVTSSADQDHHLVALPSLAPPPQEPNPNNDLYDDHHQDLNLGFTSHESSNDFKTLSQLIQVPNFENLGNTTYSTSSPTNSTTTTHHHLLAMGNSFMPMLSNMSTSSHDNNNNNNIIPSSNNTFLGFPLISTSDQYHQFMKLDNELEISNNTSSTTGTGRHLFPFEDLKLQAPAGINRDDHTNSDDHQNNIGRDHGGADEQSNGFWHGMLGTGGGSW